MTLIVDVLKRAARECSVTDPDSWVTATGQAQVELRDDFMLETIEEIVDRVDLPSPIGKQTTITGDGSEDYALPSDFKRLMRTPTAVYETTTTRRAGVPITSDGDWTHLKTIGAAGAFRYFRIQGYDGNFTIGFLANPESGQSVTVSYVSNLWMANAAGTTGTMFTAEDDVLLLPRRVVELGIVWRFRKRKGLDYASTLAEYESNLGRLVTDSRSMRSIHFGDSGRDYKPMRVPVPDYIPSS